MSVRTGITTVTGPACRRRKRRKSIAQIITFEFQLSEKNLVAEKIIRYEIDALDIDKTRAALTVYFQGSADKLHLEDTYENIKAIEAKLAEGIATV